MFCSLSRVTIDHWCFCCQEGVIWDIEIVFCEQSWNICKGPLLQIEIFKIFKLICFVLIIKQLFIFGFKA
ncbi:hypothetical protein LINGRAHAP2_LOCUS23449 [Linum grandiflorum]